MAAVVVEVLLKIDRFDVDTGTDEAILEVEVNIEEGSSLV